MVVVLIDLPVPEDGIRYSEPDTRAVYKDRVVGKGTLHVAESCVCWTNSEGKGFSLTYPSINVHAICKDTSSFPEPCLYLMLEENLEDEESDNEDDDDDESYSEMRFVPDNPDALEFLYKAMCDCQALHSELPEQDSDNEGGGGDDGAYEDADEEDGAYENGEHHTANHGSGDYIRSTASEDYQREPDFDAEENEEPMDVGQFEDA